MSKYKLKNKNFLAILFCLALVFGYSFFLRAETSAPVEFTSDTIVSLAGITDGDLYIAQNSECASIDISGSTLTVNSIPIGSSFTLKTTTHNNALKITPIGEAVTLVFSSSNLVSGGIASYTLSSSSSVAKANIVLGVPSSNEKYIVKVNNVSVNSYLSDASSEISFDYNDSLVSPKTFTLELSEGGSAFIAPTKPNISQTEITTSENGETTIENLPENITQIAISRTVDFAGVSWQDFDEEKFKTVNQNQEKLYIKFRTKNGATSEVKIFGGDENSNDENSDDDMILNDGDIVKTENNPDVYIIKIKNNEKYRRLILSPQVFESYGHLKWENIKVISQAQLDEYQISNLVQVADDENVYELIPNGDKGKRKRYQSVYDVNSVYRINQADRDSYSLVE
ncbi:MAG: hypothetical protein WC178_00210 [Candidatus Paceibacterota bacterium]